MPASGDESKGHAKELQLDVGKASLRADVLNSLTIMHESIPSLCMQYLQLIIQKNILGSFMRARFIECDGAGGGSYVST